MKISVIVPVYKAESYLHKCVDSILAQLFNDFELLLVDDGSPDNSGQICDEYERKDARVKVLHKKNGGVSSARNLGLKYAKGEWVVFIDSDDWVKKDYLENLYKGSINVDLILVGYINYTNENKVEDGECITLDCDKKVYERETIGSVFSSRLSKVCRGPWASMYKASILECNNIRFNEKMIVAEDTLFNHVYLTHCDRIRISGYCGYFFNQCRENSRYKYILDAEDTIQNLSLLYNAYNDVCNRFSFKSPIWERCMFNCHMMYYSAYLEKNNYKDSLYNIRLVLTHPIVKSELANINGIKRLGIYFLYKLCCLTNTYGIFMKIVSLKYV